MRILLPLIIGLISGTGFSADPMTAFAVGLIVAVPGYLALTVVTRILGKYEHDGGDVMNLIWELGFLAAVLVIGSGLGMLTASSLGWSATPHTLRYPLIITVFTMVSLLIGYRSTAPVGQEQNI